MPPTLWFGLGVCELLVFCTSYIYIEIRFSCAYWLLSVICLLDSHLSKCCVSHRQQISSLSNRMIAPITCHQENSSITTLRASFPTMPLFFLTFHLLLVDSCSAASQAIFGAKVLVLVCGVRPLSQQHYVNLWRMVVVG